MCMPIFTEVYVYEHNKFMCYVGYLSKLELLTISFLERNIEAFVQGLFTSLICSKI